MGQWNANIGLLLIGMFLNTYLFGLTSHQFTVYWVSKYNDPLWIRAVVLCLSVNDLVHSAVVIYSGWQTYVANLNIIGWTVPFTICATVISAVLTQSFLDHRIFTLKKNKILTGGISFFIVAGFVFGCCSAVYSSKVDRDLDFPSNAPIVACWLAFQVSANISITAVSAANLGGSQTRVRGTNPGSVIGLLRGSTKTGILAAIFSVCGLLSYSFHHYSSLYALFTLPLGRIYTNAVLSNLNIRSQPSNDPPEDVSEVRFHHSASSSEESMADVLNNQAVISSITETDSMTQTVNSNRAKKDLADRPFSDGRNVVSFEMTEDIGGTGSRLKQRRTTE